MAFPLQEIKLHILPFSMLIIISTLGRSLHASDPPLTLDYYTPTCPSVFEIVKKEMECEVISDPRSAALIVRLHFHDCFVQVGGPYWDVPVGRKDSKTASFELAASNIPTADEGLLSIITKFLYQGLSVTDLVALSGAHTIGMAHCANFRARIYGDFETTSDRSPVSETYLNNLKSMLTGWFSFELILLGNVYSLTLEKVDSLSIPTGYPVRPSPIPPQMVLVRLG
ncbi:hypothetical protein POTOM_031566 [Populus tomentosa]|uniref:peroxidase n=1 Tax=Populus tomentosa TaxID=118781 RepID=A0A8X7Z2T8_POPTO|nr:hypothetical protein POTOM_031566 [Populus tomentosa]